MKFYINFCILFFLLLASISSVGKNNNGLILRYLFNEGQGKVIHDSSGNGFDGKIKGRVEWGDFKNRKVLKFRGGTHIDVGTRINSLINSTGTLAVWCKPEKIVGSMIAWRAKGFRQGAKRLMLTFLTHRNAKLIVTSSDGLDRSGSAASPVETGQWGYFVFTFNNKKMKLYVNGKLADQAYPRTSPPNLKGVSLHIGGIDIMRSKFQGEMAKVSIYNRDLSAKQIWKNYLAGLKYLNIKLPRTVKISTNFNAKLGKLNLSCTLENIPEISKKSILCVGLNNKMKTVRLSRGKSIYPVTFSTKSLSSGFYNVTAYVKNIETNKLISLKSEERWYLPEAAQLINVQSGQKILNNMVTQLIAVDKLPVKDYQEISFINPRKGWIHISFSNKGQVSVGIDTAKYDFKKQKVEIKRFLPAGEHKLRIWIKNKKDAVSKLIIRSIPATILCGWPAVCYVKGFSNIVGGYNFNFFKNDILPNVTTLSGGARPNKEDLKAWKHAGGRYFLEQVIPHLLYRNKVRKVKVPKPLTVDYAYKHWTKCLNNPDYPDYDGILADEFSNGNEKFFNAYIKAVKRMKANSEFKNKSLYVWCGGTMYIPSQLSFKFVRSIIDAGYKIATEFYLSEPPTVAGAHEIIEYDMARHIRRWTKSLPEFASKAIVVLASYSMPPTSCNINPHVDHRVFLDMQFQYLATAPECIGLWGVMMYKMGYTDEEIMRWFGLLFRHYCIEGKTNLLSKKYGFTYNLNFIRNADFNDGLKYWTVKAAEPGSVKGGKLARLHITQGRYHGEAEGDNYLMFKRCANKPNQVLQKITGLIPGKLYSVKMIANDYNDIVQGKSIKRKLGLRISIDNVEMINKKSFISNYYRGTSFLVAQYLYKSKGPYFDYHRYVFRAKGKTAQLTISDWSKNNEPAGTIGQKVICNFIEIQPYLEGSNADDSPQFRIVPKCRRSFSKGNAFVDVGIDLSKYADSNEKYMLILRDSKGKTARGYIGASGKGETLGVNLLKNGGFNKTQLKAWRTTNSTLKSIADGQGGDGARLNIKKGANPKYAYVWQNIDTVPGKLYKAGLFVKSNGKQNNYHVRVNNKGWKYIIRGVASDKWTSRSCYLVGASEQIVFTMSMYSNLFDSVFFKEVTDCSTQGVHIFSTPDGKEQSWTLIDKNFNYNDASDYAFAIVKCK